MKGKGYVYQRPGRPVWLAQYFLDGRRIRESTGKTDREEAEEWLAEKLQTLRRGDAAPREERVTVRDLFKLVEDNYKLRRNRSIATMRYSFQHLLDFFGEKAKAIRLGHRIEDYVAHRRAEDAADATIRIELALLDRGFRLAVKKKLISPRSKPEIEKPSEDPTRVRKGFFTREQVDALVAHLPVPHAEIVRFLFWSAWRVGEARRLEWKHYFRDEAAIRLPAELSKNKCPRTLPLVGDLAAVIERRSKARRLDCPYIFHDDGDRIGDFRKRWATACKTIGVPGRIVHDLRRSGVKHLIDSGVDPHTAMAFSGHRTPSMLRRYHIIDLDDLRRAAERAQGYAGPGATVSPLRDGTATPQPPQGDQTAEATSRS
jgi:integrase